MATATLTYGTTFQTIDGFGATGTFAIQLGSCDLAVEDKSVSATTAVAGTFTLSSSDEAAVVVCTYKRTGTVTLAEDYGIWHYVVNSEGFSFTPNTSASAGDFLWMACRFGDTVAHLPTGVSISDSINGTWNLDKNQTMTTIGDSLWVFSFPNSGAGKPTVTITLPEALDIVFDYRRYQGIATSSPLDKTASADSASGTSVSTGNTSTLSQANELVISCMCTDYDFGNEVPLTATAGTGYGNLNQTQSAVQALTSSDADLFFSPSAGIGLSLYRDPIRSDTTTASSFDYASALLAQQRGAKIFATCWTPPAVWKSNSSPNAGSLNTGHYTDFSNFLVGYISAMTTNGLTVYGISCANEPDQTETNVPSCSYTAAQYDAFLQTFVPIWSTAGYTGVVQIFLPEESGWSFGQASTALSDGAISADLYGLCAHFYSGTITGAVTPAAAGGRLWQTEYANTGAYDGSMTNGITVATDIHDHLVTASANAFLYWQCYYGPNDNQSLITYRGQTPAKRYYVLGNFSKFVRPGWIRIGESDSGWGLCSAYKDAAGTQCAIVAINNTGSSVSVTFTLSGFPAGITFVTPYLTNSSNNLAAQSTINISGGAFSATLSADSVTTFYGASTSLPKSTIVSQAVKRASYY